MSSIIHTPARMSRFHTLYRSVFVQMVLLGALSFIGPALGDAITNLGGGGLSSPYLANLANSLNYVSGCLMTLFGGPLINKLGIRYSCMVAAIAMPLTGTSYYAQARFGITWYLLVAQLIGGITSGFLYVAEATAMLAYPHQNERGFYLGVWTAMRNSGSILGGAINFATNRENLKAGGISPVTYLIFIAIECAGFLVAMNISPTRRVRRKDGSKVSIRPKQSWKNEFIALQKQAMERKSWLLFIPAFYSFFYGGTMSSYLSLHFSVRSRALSSLIVPCLSVLLAIGFGRFILDPEYWCQRTRARIAFLTWLIPQALSFVWIAFEYRKFEAKKNIMDYQLNWSQWLEAFLPYLIIFSTGFLCQLSLYWVIGTLSDDMGTSATLGGLFRAYETAGQAVSYALNSRGYAGIKRSFYINCGLLVLTCPCMILLAELIPKTSSQNNNNMEGNDDKTDDEV